MEKKGSITVFLALILSLLLSLVTTGIQSVQAAAARTQILNSMDIGLYSLFGQYDRFLMKEYDLFFIDGAQGNSDLNLAAVYDNLESYSEGTRTILLTVLISSAAALLFPVNSREQEAGHDA